MSNQSAALVARFGADLSDLKAKMAEAKGEIGKYGQSLMDVAKTVGLAFGVREVADFALEITKLAGQADGVKQAFDKIQHSAVALEQMREATRGTVSNLALMQSAVQASNFTIPIEQLGTLFQFAYERAKATGQSVDYLVNSIVTGIGRKSPLILDNLGISAVQLKEKLGGVSTEAASIGQIAEAVGKIASESLEKTGQSAVTAAERIARIGASWENIKEKLGAGLADLIAGDEANDLLTNFNNQLTVWGDSSISIWDKLTGSAQDYADMVAEINTRQKVLADSDMMTSKDWKEHYLATSDKAAAAKAAAPAAAGKRKISTSIDASSEMAALATDAGNWMEGLRQTAATLQVDVIGPLSEVSEFAMEIEQSQTDFEKQQYQERLDAFMEAERLKRETTEETAKVLGANFGMAAGGAMTLANAIAASSRQIVEELSNTAFAGLIARIMETVPFPFNIGLIAAGKAFLASQLASIGGGSRGGGGGGGYAASSSEKMRSNPSLYSANTQTMQGKVQIDGTTLNIIFGRQATFNGYTQPAFAPIGG